MATAPTPSPLDAQVQLFQSLLATIDDHHQKMAAQNANIRTQVQQAVDALKGSAAVVAAKAVPVVGGAPAPAPEPLVTMAEGNGVQAYTFRNGERWTFTAKTKVWKKL